MNRIFLMRNGKSVSASINGATIYKNFEDDEQARAFYAQCNVLKQTDDVEELKKILDASYRITQNEYLEKDGNNNVYLKGYNLPMPQMLVDRIMENLEDGIPILHLVNFWKLCMTNPDPRARQDLFSFASKFNFPITDFGYFIAYKAVAWKGLEKQHEGIAIATKFVNCKSNGIATDPIEVWRSGNRVEFFDTHQDFEDMLNEMVEETDNDFNIHVWAQENDNIAYQTRNLSHLSEEELLEYVINDPDFQYIKEDTREKLLKEYEFLGDLTFCFGNVSGMFQNDDEAFTDWHTKKMTINIGKPVTMDRQECDSDPYQTCSSGLHVGAPGYVSTFGRGDKNYILAVMVNPANVVAVPVDYGYEKMRVCEYYPYALCESKDGEIQEIKTTHFEEDYIGYEVEAINNEIQKYEKKESFLNTIADSERESVEKVMQERLVFIGSAIQ